MSNTCQLNKKDEQEIYRFDPKTQLPQYGVMCYTGRTGSGKTVLMLDHLYHLRNRLDIVMLFCGSKETTKEYRRHIPGILTFDGFFPDVIENVYNWLETQVEFGRRIRVCLIFDDLAYLKGSISNHPIMTRIAYNGRHAGILCMMALQYAKNVSVGFRNQVRFVFSAAENAKSNRERIYEAFNPIFSSFKDYDKVFTACTENYEAFVASCTYTGSSKVKDNVFYTKANLKRTKGRWKVNKGGIMWSFNRANFDPFHFMKPQDKKIKGKCRKAITVADKRIVKYKHRIEKRGKRSKKTSNVYPYIKTLPKKKRRM